MKPVPFDYVRPETLGEACAALAADPEATVLAGGQTLIPMLNMRLARPTRVVDIASIPDLTGIEEVAEPAPPGREETTARPRASTPLRDRPQPSPPGPAVSGRLLPDTGFRMDLSGSVPGATPAGAHRSAAPRDLTPAAGAGTAIRIGAMTRQAAAEAHPLVRSRLPLLAKALPWVGHAPTRARGTVGGSVANADPAAEIPLVLAALDGTIHWQGPDGPGSARAGDFLRGPMETTLPAGAVLTTLDFSLWPGRTGAGFAEVATRASDYALVSAAAQVTLDADGRCIRAAAAVGGAVDRPTRVDVAPLTGAQMTDDTIADTVRAAVEGLPISPPPHTTETYCRRAAARLLGQALTQARDSA